MDTVIGHKNVYRELLLKNIIICSLGEIDSLLKDRGHNVYMLEWSFAPSRFWIFGYVGAFKRA